MSSIAQNQDRDPQQQPENLAQPADCELPARYRQEQTVACMLFSQYSDEAKTAFKKVQQKAQEWFGEESSREDSGRIFDMSMTLFLTPSQRSELAELVKDTPLEAYTVKDIAEAIERGVRGDAPRVESANLRRHLNAIERGINAGYAMAELSAGGLAWDKQRLLTFDIWNGLNQLQNVAASILQNVQADITGGLIAQAEAARKLSPNANIFEVANGGIYIEAARRTMEFAQQSGHLKEIQDAMLPLARTILALPSPILKEVVYSQMESCYDLLGRGLGLYGADPQPMVQGLDDWKAFWDTQVPLLSRYFEETAAEKSRATAAGASEEKINSMWRCSGSYHGDKVALMPNKWDETIFNEIRSEHMWGMRLIGVPGAIGDRAYEVVLDVLARANAEAFACRPAYGLTLVERELNYFPDLDEIPEENRKLYEQHIARMTERKLKEANQLVHGITDSLIGSLPWSLPGDTFPLTIDPKLHLERTMSLLEKSMRENDSPGLAFATQASAQELAIQLESWTHVGVLDAQPELAARAKKLFEDAKVHLPDDWCTGLRNRGILPPVQQKAVGA